MAAATIGLFSVNSHACADPAVSARIAVLAEELGYDSLWAGEHVVLPSPRVAPSPMEPDEPILDPLLSLTHLAAHTSRVKLGTGVIVLPQRHPLILAKQLASLNVLSGGRLIVMPRPDLSEVELVEFVRANAPDRLGAEGSS